MSRDNPVLFGVLIAAVAVLVVGVVVALVEDDEPTQAQAEEQFCDDVGAFLAALGALRDSDVNTPIDEFEQTREDVETTYNNMINSAQQVREVRVDELQQANANLRAAVEDINDEQSLSEALDSVKDEADAVAEQISSLFNDINCGSSQGAQENSDE
jgi:hypothetical protein